MFTESEVGRLSPEAGSSKESSQHFNRATVTPAFALGLGRGTVPDPPST